MAGQQDAQTNEVNTVAAKTTSATANSKAFAPAVQSGEQFKLPNSAGAEAIGEQLLNGLTKMDWDNFKGLTENAANLIKKGADGLVKVGNVVLPGLEIVYNQVQAQLEAGDSEPASATLNDQMNDPFLRQVIAGGYYLPPNFTRQQALDAMGLPPEQVGADRAASMDQSVVAMTRSFNEHLMRLCTGLPDTATDQEVRQKLGLDVSASANQVWHALGMDRDGNTYHEQSLKALGMPAETSDARLKGALGLPYSATDKEVFEAVQKKLYERDSTGELKLLEGEAKSPVRETDQERFQLDVLESKEPVVVQFTAPWCREAKNMDFSLDKLAADNPGVKVMKVNVDHSRELAQRYGISSVPTTLIFQGGQVVDRQTGVRYSATLQADLDRIIKE